MVQSNRIQELWRRIECVLQTYVPETAKTLAPAATDGEIAELEHSIHLKLPIDFRESLRIHNGQNDPTRCHSFSGEGILLSTQQVADSWRLVTEINETESRRWPNSSEQGPWWKTSCIPFTEDEGDMICIDMDPRLGNRIGEVVCFVHDGEIERGLGASFEDWLTSLAVRLDSCCFRMDEYGYLRLNPKAVN